MILEYATISWLAGCLSVSPHYNNGLNALMDWKVHVVNLELKSSFCMMIVIFMDENRSIMKKYAELYYASVWRLV